MSPKSKFMEGRSQEPVEDSVEDSPLESGL